MIKQLMRLALTLLLGVFLWGCGLSTRALRISQGMTMQQVVAIMGSPDHRRFNINQEEWEYRETIGDKMNVLIVTFVGQRVDKLDSYDMPASEGEPLPPGYESGPSRPQITPPLPIPGEVYPPNYPPRGGYPDRPMIDERWFADFYNHLKRVPYPRDRREMIANATLERYFTVGQSCRLLSLYSYDDDRLDILRLLSGRIVDLEYADRILEMFRYRSSQEKAHSLLIPPRGGYGVGPNRRPVDPRMVIDERWFEDFYQRVKAKPFSDDKLEYISVAAHTRFFTVHQVSRLMQLYTFDDDRLKVLRLVARRIVDMENADRLLDLFTFKSGRSEARKHLGL
ncbi:MAG: DUF4476 domain-containing protein [Porphyromonadaceae bacterium]|nr:DUF4476 domain-containing protein [Porphyromonadaceae bacterium]